MILFSVNSLNPDPVRIQEKTLNFWFYPNPAPVVNHFRLELNYSLDPCFVFCCLTVKVAIHKIRPLDGFLHIQLWQKVITVPEVHAGSGVLESTPVGDKLFHPESEQD